MDNKEADAGEFRSLHAPGESKAREKVPTGYKTAIRVRFVAKVCGIFYSSEEELRMPLLTMTTSLKGRDCPFTGLASILRTTSIPSRTRPNTTCLPSSQEVLTVVMKNSGKDRKETTFRCQFFEADGIAFGLEFHEY